MYARITPLPEYETTPDKKLNQVINRVNDMDRRFEAMAEHIAVLEDRLKGFDIELNRNRTTFYTVCPGCGFREDFSLQLGCRISELIGRAHYAMEDRGWRTCGNRDVYYCRRCIQKQEELLARSCEWRPDE